MKDLAELLSRIAQKIRALDESPQIVRFEVQPGYFELIKALRALEERLDSVLVTKKRVQ